MLVLLWLVEHTLDPRAGQRSHDADLGKNRRALVLDQSISACDSGSAASSIGKLTM
jgi:hypothetical protein